MSVRTSKETRSGLATFGITGDENTGLHSPSADRVQLLAGGTAVFDSLYGGGKMTSLVLTAAATGVQGSLQNPWAVPMLITRVILVVTTVATGAATISVGVAATSVTNNGLIDALDVNAATGVFDNTINHGTAGKAGKLLGATDFITVFRASGDPTGMVATLYIWATPT